MRKASAFTQHTKYRCEDVVKGNRQRNVPPWAGRRRQRDGAQPDRSLRWPLTFSARASLGPWHCSAPKAACMECWTTRHMWSRGLGDPSAAEADVSISPDRTCPKETEKTSGSARTKTLQGFTQQQVGLHAAVRGSRASRGKSLMPWGFFWKLVFFLHDSPLLKGIVLISQPLLGYDHPLVHQTCGSKWKFNGSVCVVANPPVDQLTGAWWMNRSLNITEQ